ncbi:unnamed protein product [Zymoseptoria tritici ST99CH_3D1]|nr:unnamed protein product [Zymoseptoria tritici ST99CH_3D1]
MWFAFSSVTQPAGQSLAQNDRQKRRDSDSAADAVGRTGVRTVKLRQIDYDAGGARRKIATQDGYQKQQGTSSASDTGARTVGQADGVQQGEAPILRGRRGGHDEDNRTRPFTYGQAGSPKFGPSAKEQSREIDPVLKMDRAVLRRDSLLDQRQSAKENAGRAEAARSGSFAMGAKEPAQAQSSALEAGKSTNMASDNHTQSGESSLPIDLGSSSLNRNKTPTPAVPVVTFGNASYTPMTNDEKVLAKQKRLRDKMFAQQAEIREAQKSISQRSAVSTSISATTGTGRDTALLPARKPQPGQMGSGNEDDGQVLQVSKPTRRSRAVSVISIGSSDDEEETVATQPVPQSQPAGFGPASTAEEGPNFILKDLRGDRAQSIKLTIPQKRPRSKSPSSSDDSDSAESDEEEEEVETLVQPPTKPSKKRAKPEPQSLYFAEIDETATRVGPSTGDCAESDMIRLRSLFAVIDSQGNEREMKNAARQAVRLTHRWNVTKAEVISHFEGRQDQDGISTVAIRRRDGNKELPVLFNAWTNDLCHAIKLFFATKVRTQNHHAYMKGVVKTDFIYIKFGGIAENTVASAHAFVKIYNDISRWALEYKGIPARSSYCRGVCKGLHDMAMLEREYEARAAQEAGRTRERDHARRIQEEEKARQAEIEHEAEETSKADQDDHDGDNDDNELDDFEQEHFRTLMSEARARKMPTPPPDYSGQPAANTTSKPEDKPEAAWKDETTMVTFYKNADQIADEAFAKAYKGKVKKGRKSQAKSFDKAAYESGQVDAKKLAPKRQAIKGQGLEDAET